MNNWTSPDGRVTKTIIKPGESNSLKPTEYSECTIQVTDSNIPLVSSNITIGDNDCKTLRLLDIALQTMSIGEVSKIQFDTTCITLELISVTTKGLIYEWKADFKQTLALANKVKGTELFRKGDFINASFRYSKALKLLCSIPIAVENPPECIDGVSLDDINALKVILYSNLASCYLKVGNFKHTLGLCERVLKLKPDEFKATYKLGVACAGLEEYERAMGCFNKVIAVEPDNKAALQQISRVRMKLVEQDAVYKSVVKKMFS